jgi:CTP:phosphocholine cytidylyltransferase-like protein
MVYTVIEYHILIRGDTNIKSIRIIIFFKKNKFCRVPRKYSMSMIYILEKNIGRNTHIFRAKN